MKLTSAIAQSNPVLFKELQANTTAEMRKMFEESVAKSKELASGSSK